MGVFGTGALLHLFSSLPEDPQLSALLPLYCYPAARRVIGSYLRCWRKHPLKLCYFAGSSRADGAREGHVFRIQRFDREVTDLARKVSGLKSWCWSMRTAGNTKF